MQNEGLENQLKQNETLKIYNRSIREKRPKCYEKYIVYLT